MITAYEPAYAAFCQIYAAELPVFFQPWWLDAVGQQGRWQKYVIQDGEGQVIGIWPVFSKRKYGLRWHTLPPYTPVSGPWFGTADALTEALLQALVKKLAGNSLYWLIQSMRYVQQPDWWQSAGFEVDTRHTYQLPATDDPQELFRRFRSTTRNEIKKAERNLQVRAVSDLRKFMPLYTRHAESKGIFSLAAAQALEAIHGACLEHGQGQILLAYDAQENLYAGILTVWDQKTTYLLVISRNEDFQTSPATRLLLWQAIQQSAASGRTFDFEGGNIPSIGDFFASFGATKTAYLRAILYPNALIRSAVRLAKYVRHPRSRFFR